MKIINFIIEYWSTIVGIIAVITALILRVAKLNKGKISNWLIAAVTAAEKELGSGTGELKLRVVYDQFVHTFPLISLIISFTTFSNWVDTALNEMRVMLENKSIKEYVSCDKK